MEDAGRPGLLAGAQFWELHPVASKRKGHVKGFLAGSHGGQIESEARFELLRSHRQEGRLAQNRHQRISKLPAFGLLVTWHTSDLIFEVIPARSIATAEVLGLLLAPLGL